MRVLAICNQKGGTGKTTTAVSMAAAMVEQGLRVMLIDLDPQASASAWLGDSGNTKGLQEVFAGNARIADYVANTSIEGLGIVPSSSWLAVAERQMIGEPGAELILAGAIRHLPPEWDYILLDCPPTLGLLSVSAMAAANAVLAPVEPSPMALAGLVRLQETEHAVRSRLNSALEPGYILACRVDQRTKLTRDVLESLRKNFGGRFLKFSIRESVRVREAWSYKEPVTLYAPDSTSAEDYRAATTELLLLEKQFQPNPVRLKKRA